jgi:predicted GIY-YIG superfamily endonuclease
MQGIGKRFVYILRSGADPDRHYVGLTSDVDNRLEWHNRGPCGHTVEHRPWSLAVVIEFPTEQQAARFEQYLKSGSGRAFAKRHFGPDQKPASRGNRPGRPAQLKPFTGDDMRWRSRAVASAPSEAVRVVRRVVCGVYTSRCLPERACSRCEWLHPP